MTSQGRHVPTSIGPTQSRRFRPRLRAPSSIKRVLRAAQKSGRAIKKTRASSRIGKRLGARLGRGHTVTQLTKGRQGIRGRRAVVKARIVRFNSAGPQAMS